MSNAYYLKLIRVVRSCKTLDQWVVAKRLVKRVCRQSGTHPGQLETLTSLMNLQRRLV